MRQLQVLHEARRLDVVGMRQHELLVLRRRGGRFGEFLGTQRAIDQRHRHGLALAMAEGEPVAARELRRHVVRARELVDHVAFGDVDLGDLDGEAQLLGHEADGHLAVADLADEGMVVAVAALGRVAQRQQEAFVAARQVLQAHRAARRQGERLARQVFRRAIVRRRLQHALALEDVADARQGAVGVGGRGRCGRPVAFGCQREVEQAMGVVVGRAQHLAARHVLEGRRDAPLGHHGRGVERQRIAEARQGRAIGAQQEDGLDQVATRLLDGECGERTVVAGALGHHAIDGEPELLVDLFQRELGDVAIAAALVGHKVEGMGDGRLAPFDCDVHVSSPRRCCAAGRRARCRR